MQMAPSIYFYPFTSYTENGSNTTILGGTNKVLIDPGHKRHWPALKAKIEADGLSVEEISLVIHTHCHPDHMEAGEILQKEYNITQAMSGVEAEFLKGPGLEFFPMMGLEPFEGTIDKILEPGPLDLGDKTLYLYLSPGHTPGSLCIHWPEAKILITGDVIFAQSVGRTDFPGGNHDQLRQSIETLRKLTDVDLIYPGHGPTIEGPEKVAVNYKVIENFF